MLGVRPVMCSCVAIGYLVKLKGNLLQNRTRFFRLTDQRLSYYEENAGKYISSVNRFVRVSSHAVCGCHVWRYVTSA